MQKNIIIVLRISDLWIAIGVLHLISSYEEPNQAAEDSSGRSSSDSSNGRWGSNNRSISAGSAIIAGMDIGRFVQTASFFAIAGLASTSVAAWIIITPRKRRIIQ